MVYSTCTFAPEENELTVAAILAEYPGEVRLVPAAIAGLITAPGLTQWEGQELPAELGLALRIWPHHNDTGGFFIAVLEKDAGARAEPEPRFAALDAADGDDWLPDLAAHYGLPHDYWAPFRAQRQTRRGLHLMAADHRPPAVPRAEGSGLFFHRTQVRPPKPTTGGAMLFGTLATRCHLPLTLEQRDRYLRREQFEPTADQRANPPGQVVVSYRGQVLGVAVLHRSGVIESLFPSRWSGCTGGSGPDAGAAEAEMDRGSANEPK